MKKANLLLGFLLLFQLVFSQKEHVQLQSELEIMMIEAQYEQDSIKLEWNSKIQNLKLEAQLKESKLKMKAQNLCLI